MELNYSEPRRRTRRKPREGYIQTLQLTLIPDAKFNIVFWAIMTLISAGFAYFLASNPVAYYLHMMLTLGGGAIEIKYWVRYHMLNKALNKLIKERSDIYSTETKITNIKNNSIIK